MEFFEVNELLQRLGFVVADILEDCCDLVDLEGLQTTIICVGVVILVVANCLHCKEEEKKNEGERDLFLLFVVAFFAFVSDSFFWPIFIFPIELLFLVDCLTLKVGYFLIGVVI